VGVGGSTIERLYVQTLNVGVGAVGERAGWCCDRRETVLPNSGRCIDANDGVNRRCDSETHPMRAHAHCSYAAKNEYGAMYLITGDLSFHQGADSAATSTGLRFAVALQFVVLHSFACGLDFFSFASGCPQCRGPAITSTAFKSAGSPSITGVCFHVGFFWIAGSGLAVTECQWARLSFGVVAPLLTALNEGINSFGSPTASPAMVQNNKGCFVSGARNHRVALE